MKKTLWGFRISTEPLKDAVEDYATGVCVPDPTEASAVKGGLDLAKLLASEQGAPCKLSHIIKITVETIPYHKAKRGT